MCRPVASPVYEWEVGAGVSAAQFPRVYLRGFSTSADGHELDMQIRQTVWAGNVLLARQLSPSFAADFQTSIGASDSRLLLLTGLGLQYRVGRWFSSRQVDPYLRIGANYLYKGFGSWYDDGTVGYKVERAGGHHLFAVALGAGTNLWLNDRLGLGLQGDYLLITRRGTQGSLQGTVRAIWRFGKSRGATRR